MATILGQKREREEKLKESNTQEMKMDPYEFLPIEVFSMILKWLDAEQLKSCHSVSKGWNVTCYDHSIWHSLCDKLWSSKVYVPSSIRELSISNPREAYFKSIEDSKREHISEEELCSFTWDFRFKAAAGDDWTERDPWWNGKPVMKHKYHLDHGCEIIVAEGNDFPEYAERERRWKWVESAAGKTGPRGSFLQVNNFPPYVFSRSQNWGFIMQSCWVLLTSFAMPEKGACPSLEDENLEVTTKMMQQEAMAYNIGIQIPFFQNLPIQVLQELIAQGLLDEENEDDLFVELDDIVNGHEDDEESDREEMENVD